MSEAFSQSVIEFFGEHGDDLPIEIWQLFHRWYHATEMAKCDAEVSATQRRKAAANDDEKKQLEENILRDGIQDPLKVWNGILIDGHNRYEIAQAHGLEFKTVEMQFDSRDDVKIWIIKNQLGRRNINDYTRGELITQFKTIIAARAKEKQLSTLKQNTVLANLPERSEAVNTRDELAKMADVSSRTMAKIETLTEEASPEIKSALRTGDISISAAYLQAKKKPFEKSNRKGSI